MVDSSARAPVTADYSQWQARDYFQTYYSEVVLPDEQVVLRYQLQALSGAARFGRGLEYGCGPTLHRAIAAAKYVFRLDLADWLPDNLRLVRDWLQADGGNADWNRFTRYILECESSSPADARRIARRELMTRRVVRGLHTSDARWRHPLGSGRESYYDVMITGFCLDAVSSNKSIWRSCMRNVLSMLAPGGLLVLHALHRCKAYKVGARMFPGANVSVDDMARSLAECGFVGGSSDIQIVPCPDNRVYGYDGILMVTARKKARG